MIEISWRGRVWLIDLGPVTLIIVGLSVLSVAQAAEGNDLNAVYLMLLASLILAIREAIWLLR